jgi:hypothetical protein
MNTYMIRRKHAWQSPEEAQQVAGRSGQVADNDFPDDIRWIRSYVIADASRPTRVSPVHSRVARAERAESGRI